MMTKSVIAGVIAALAGGCKAPRTASALSSARTESPAPNLITVTCIGSDGTPKTYQCEPSCEDCCPCNGTGVYTAEDGYAGIGDTQLMITHFINNTSTDGFQYVSFEGRYFDSTRQRWDLLTGVVDGARHLGTTWDVRSVTESATAPRWTLMSGSETLTDQLELHISFVIGDNNLMPQRELVTAFEGNTGQENPWVLRARTTGRQLYALTFTGDPTNAFAPRTYTYSVSWLGLLPETKSPQPYCLAPNKGTMVPDSVVFQQGIDVHPVRGKVGHATNHVTMSCTKGAPAIVYSWDYDYDTLGGFDYFAAAIQMKRASYCADENYYTQAGTEITIHDDKKGPLGNLEPREAWWTPDGAICLNEPRHEDIVKTKGFTRMCNGKPLPACNGAPPPHSLGNDWSNSN